MPILQRKQLRRDLGIRRLAETVIGTTSLSLGANASLAVMDQRLALPDFSGQDFYTRGWLRVASVDYRVGSFNVGSGAFVGLTGLVNAIASGADFEVHEKISPAEIDNAIDETILDLRVRREVGIPTISGLTFYTLDGAASPNTIVQYLGAYYFGNPGGSLSRDRREFDQYAVVTTATGIELRPGFALGASMQIVIDAVLQLTLGTGGDAATINYPDEETILWGAAARCYDVLIQRASDNESKLLQGRRREAAMKYTRLARRWGPDYRKKITFETPFESPSPGWNWLE